MKTTKPFTLVLILLLATSSALWIESISAQLMTSPPAPEFTLKLVDYSYDVPATTSVDPYTGQQITNQAYTVLNKTIDVVITNLDLTTFGENNTIIYSIQRKAHLEQNWQEMYGSESGGYMQTTSKYTVVSFAACYQEDAQIDFQVKATLVTFDVSQSASRLGWSFQYEEVGKSGWSSTQTITIDNGAFQKPDASTSGETVTLTPTSDVAAESALNSSNYPQFGWEQIIIAVISATITVLAVGLAVVWRRLPQK